jgi:hypothetical protein
MFRFEPDARVRLIPDPVSIHDASNNKTPRGAF